MYISKKDITKDEIKTIKKSNKKQNLFTIDT